MGTHPLWEAPRPSSYHSICCATERQRAMRGLWCCSSGSCCGTEMPNSTGELCLPVPCLLVLGKTNPRGSQPLACPGACSVQQLLPFGHPCTSPVAHSSPSTLPSPGQVTTGWAAAPAVPQPSPVTALDSALPQQSRAWKNKLTLQRCFSRVFIQCQSEEQNSVQTTPQCLAGCCTEPWVGEFTVGGGGRGCSFAV